MTIPDDDPLRAWHFRQLKWSLQALAASPSDQLALFPTVVVKADELAWDFDHWASVIRTGYEQDLSGSRAESLRAIDEKLSTMSRDGVAYDAELWSEAALSSSPHWEDVRRLATSALEAFGWALDGPPQGG